MAKYIDSGKLLKAVEKELENLEPPRKKGKSNIEYSMGRFETERAFRFCLFLAECEDVAPVVHAHWRWMLNYDVVCSNCQYVLPSGSPVSDFRFCPWCGAKMDEKEGNL